MGINTCLQRSCKCRPRLRVEKMQFPATIALQKVAVSSVAAVVTAFPAAILLFVVAASLRGAAASLNVMAGKMELLVARLREAIVVDEGDLDLTPAPTHCSSLSGPRCLADAIGGTVEGLWDSSDDQAALFAVDGVVPPWIHTLRDSHDEALELLANNGAGQQAVRHALAAYVREVPEVLSAFDRNDQWLPSRINGDRSNGVPENARTKCFRLRLERLSPLALHIPEAFSVGLPPALAIQWDGRWEVTTGCVQPDVTSGERSFKVPNRRRRLCVAEASLKSEFGYMRLKHPVIIRRLLVTVPQANVKSIICGFLAGEEKWCVSPPAGVLRVDVSNHFFAIDELAFSSLPASLGPSLARVEFIASLNAVADAQGTGHRRVVLLRPTPPGGLEHGFEPVVTSVSREAAVWNLNDILRGRVRLRHPLERRFDYIPHASQRMMEGLRVKGQPIWLQRISRACKRVVYAICRWLQSRCPNWRLLDAQMLEPRPACWRLLWLFIFLNMCASLFSWYMYLHVQA